MKTKKVRRKALALAIFSVMIVSILTAFVSIHVLATGNVYETQIYKNSVHGYAQAGLSNNPAPIQNAVMPAEQKKLPMSYNDFKKMSQEMHEHRFQENLKEEKERRGTYFDITGNFKTLWVETFDVDLTQALIAGDLDGDGLDDVLVTQHKYDDVTGTKTREVMAKRGYDGKHLWEESINVSNGYWWIWAMPAGDLDGDGLDDVLVTLYKYDDVTGTETGEVIAKRGYDGKHLWEESINVTNGYCGLSAIPAGDLDGDGLDDVLVNLYKYDDVTGTETGEVIAKRGYDGKHLWEKSINVSNGYCGIWANPAGDLDGDGLDDVLVTLHKHDDVTGTETGELIAKRGYDGENLWEEAIKVTNGHCGIWAMPTGDLDGDGLDDVLVTLHSHDDVTGTETGEVIAKRGYDGENLWEESIKVSNGFCWIWTMPTGDLDGDGLDDVLVTLDKYDDRTGTETGEVIAKRGYDGENLWEEAIKVTNGYCRIWTMPTGDLDGDGLDDVLVTLHKHDDGTGTETGELIAKRGYDGENLWEESIKVSNGYCRIEGYPTGDFDGDGLDDVLVTQHSHDDVSDTEMGEVIAKRGYDGENLWEEAIKVSNGYCWIWTMPTGDLDGDGLDDVVVNRHKYEAITDTSTNNVIAKRGYDGKHLWEAISGDYIWVAMPLHEYNKSQKVGYDLNGDGIDDTILGNSTTIYALTYAATSGLPKISVSTDKSEYRPCDTMLITINIANPTDSPVTFKWFLGSPTRDFWISVSDVKLPAGFEATMDVSLYMGSWGKTPFSAVWYVDLQDPETGQVLAADCTCWSYCPKRGDKEYLKRGEKAITTHVSKSIPVDGLAKEIQKQIEAVR